MRKTLGSSLLCYAIAVLSVIAAAMLTWALWPLTERSIFVFFILAVMLSAWRGGHGPGLVAAFLSAALSDYLFISPLHTLSWHNGRDVVRLFLFLAGAVAISILTAQNRRTGRVLARSSKALKAIIQASPLAIVTVGTDRTIETWNSAAERMFGWTAEEVVGGSNPIVWLDNLEANSGLCDKASQDSTFTARETICLKKDGSHVNISLSTGPIRDARGSSTGAILVIADITEQKRAEAALQESEQRFRATFEHAAVGIVQATRRGELLMVNQKFCDLLGYTQTELLNMSVADITLPSDLQLSLRSMERLWAGEFPSAQIEKHYLRKDGSLVSANLSVSVLRDGSGDPLYFIAVVEDTTTRNQAEEALRESEERFRAIFERATVGIAQLSTDGKWIMVNQRLCGIVGYTEAELLDRTFAELTHPEDLETSRAGAQALLTGEIETFAMEKRYLHKNGSAVWVHVSSSVVRDASGDPRFFLTVTQDIDERKRAEESLVRLATAVEQAAESIVITDANGVIQYVNPAFERTTGYAREEAINQNPRVLRSGKQDQAFYDDLWATIKRGDVWTGHFINRKKDGTLYEEEATISPVRDVSGDIVNYVAVKRDVTREVGLESQLTQAQKMEAVGQLAGGIAHDFNNLLTAVIGYSQLALRNLTDRDPVRADLVEIEKAGLRAAELTGQLLAFSRKQVFQPKKLDLNALVTDLQKMLRRLIGEDIDLVAVLDLELGTVKADRGQLQQVIMNLIVNARDAMPEGGKLTIETANVDLDYDYAAQHLDVTPGAYCLLAISDNGCGMDEQTKSHIFEPFFTTKALGRGTGLGLSTVYGIVKQSGGYVSVYSEPGCGTTFKVYLPRVIEPIEDEGLPPDFRSLPHGDERVLLVEDDSAVREFASRVLRDHGYTVLEAPDPSGALRTIAERKSDNVQLMVTDVVMPRMSGRELAEQLAQARPDMRVLYVSGYTDRAIVHHGVLDEGTPFLQKPFTAEALVRKVREVLDDPVGAGLSRT